MLKSEFVVTEAFDDQKPGTSGLRKPTKRFVENKYYTENFIQVIKTLISGRKVTLKAGDLFLNE